MPSVSVPKADIHAAIDRAAKRILAAAGPDKATTQAELKKSLTSLHGADKKFATAFLDFIEQRNGPKQGVSKSDVQAAVRYAKKTMVDAYDANGNGAIESKEKSKMSKTAKLAIDSARALKGEAPATSQQVSQLLGELSKTVRFDYFGSESDAPFKSFAAAGTGGAVTEAAFRKSLSIPAGEPYETRDIASFFTAMQEPDQVGSATDRAKFAEIEKVMKQNLTDLKVFVRGEGAVEGKVYLVGRAKDGNLVGLESTRIWT